MIPLSTQKRNFRIFQRKVINLTKEERRKKERKEKKRKKKIRLMEKLLKYDFYCNSCINIGLLNSLGN